MMDYAAVFLDGGYLDKVLEVFNFIAIDYEAFSDELCRRSGGFSRFRTYYYHCAPYQSNPPTIQESERYARKRQFYSALRYLNRFEVRLGKLEMRRCPRCSDARPRQKRVDSKLAIDLVRLAAKGHVKKAILVAGDSDHAPAVEVAKEESVLVTLWHLPNSVTTTAHGELKQLCDERYEITEQLLKSVTRKQANERSFSLAPGPSSGNRESRQNHDDREDDESRQVLP